jgi:Uma2 family endonuclease
MGEAISKEPHSPGLDLTNIEIEDGLPVDNILSEKEMRLLTESLYTSWRPLKAGEPRPFAALSNVGLFSIYGEPPIVPDVMVSLDVVLSPETHEKEDLSYFLWVVGKPPDIVIEIVSNKIGGEDTTKLEKCAAMGVAYYAIYDPAHHLSKRSLRVFERHANSYIEILDPTWLPFLGLGLTIWKGTYEGSEGVWLRWLDEEKRVVPTGLEAADAARSQAQEAMAEAQTARKAEQSAREAEQSAREAEQSAREAEQRSLEKARRMAEKLRSLGLDPEED